MSNFKTRLTATKENKAAQSVDLEVQEAQSLLESMLQKKKQLLVSAKKATLKAGNTLPYSPSSILFAKESEKAIATEIEGLTALLKEDFDVTA